MEHVTMSLCPACTACPEVEISSDEVRIGEAGNLAVLKKDEWNPAVPPALEARRQRRSRIEADTVWEGDRAVPCRSSLFLSGLMAVRRPVRCNGRVSR